MLNYNYQLFIKNKDSNTYKPLYCEFNSSQLSQLIFFLDENFPNLEFEIVLKDSIYNEIFYDIEGLLEWENYRINQRFEDYI